MASIFRRDDEFFEKPNRNTVDFSFQNNLTAKFGALYPCFCTPVIPGDSLSIKPTFGLKFMPMTFPVQTRMKASIHYFYVRNRNLWKDWPDFIGKTKEGLIPPYLYLTEQNRKMIETCQLGDYLGIPTEIYDNIFQDGGVSILVQAPSVSYGPSYAVGVERNSNGTYSSISSKYLVCTEELYNSLSVGKEFIDSYINKARPTSLPSQHTPDWTVISSTIDLVDARDTHKIKMTLGDWWNNPSVGKVVIFDAKGKCRFVSDEITFPYGDNSNIGWEMEFDVHVTDDWKLADDTYGEALITMIRKDDLNWYQSMKPDYKFGNIVSSQFNVADVGLSDLPWRSEDNSNGIPLSALPFRAYESIYNTFYRNAENNPLIINGVPEYNKWLRSTDGGADTNFYPLMYHNWEDDFLTTAVPSPQQGNAPLVGLSGTPTLTIAHDDGSTTTMNLVVDDDGNVTAATPQTGDAVTHAAIADAVNYGISINDFRNVNSFQRWLENNIRRGYKYRDQIKTHYGVTVRYDELDMPEFIGGTSENVMVNQISQTTPVDGKGLGDMAGQASAVGQGQTITHYCDEHGFIIGILCIKPVANYSQLLPKFFNVTDTFDYYFPEFGHIGMQPITYAEVTPLQANLEGKLDDVFGYQRAWYDLIAKTDEVHGLFRSDFRNFLINRTFDGTPELGADFTVIDPEQINDVFQYQGNTDKILGQIYMEISKKTPIPLYGIPKLE